MPTIMENWETHKPVAEEERLETAHEGTHTREASARPEVADNPRIRALMATRDEANRKLQEAILDLETREESAAFHKATELLGDGWHLVDLEGYEGFRHLYLLPKDIEWNPQDAEQYEYTYVNRGAGKLIEIVDEDKNIFHDLGLEHGAYGFEVIKHLAALTQEDPTFPLNA